KDLDELLPRRLILQKKMIAAFQGNESCPWNESGERPAFIKRRRCVLAYVEHEGRAADLLRGLAQIEREDGAHVACRVSPGRRLADQFVEQVNLLRRRIWNPMRGVELTEGGIFIAPAQFG